MSIAYHIKKMRVVRELSRHFRNFGMKKASCYTGRPGTDEVRLNCHDFSFFVFDHVINFSDMRVCHILHIV